MESLAQTINDQRSTTSFMRVSVPDTTAVEPIASRLLQHRRSRSALVQSCTKSTEPYRHDTTRYDPHVCVNASQRANERMSAIDSECRSRPRLSINTSIPSIPNDSLIMQACLFLASRYPCSITGRCPQHLTQVKRAFISIWVISTSQCARLGLFGSNHQATS